MRNVVLVSKRLRPVRDQGIAFPAGHDVDVEVEDALPPSSAVRLEQIESIGFQGLTCGMRHPAGQFPHGRAIVAIQLPDVLGAAMIGWPCVAVAGPPVNATTDAMSDAKAPASAALTRPFMTIPPST
jgi:hypothetical protein